VPIEAIPFTDLSVEPHVRGFLHRPENDTGCGLVLTHGAGANCQSKLLTAVASAFAEAGCTVLRCDLPFRQERPHGPPFPGRAAKDQKGLERAVMLLKERIILKGRAQGRIFLGGHSYGGRQATILASENPQLVNGLLLLSYPLHPPRKPTELRTSHFPALQTPALFVHGTRDPFGSVSEMRSALEAIPADKILLEVEGAGHDLLPRKAEGDVPKRIVEAWKRFFSTADCYITNAEASSSR